MEDHKEAVIYHQLNLKLCEELRDRYTLQNDVTNVIISSLKLTGPLNKNNSLMYLTYCHLLSHAVSFEAAYAMCMHCNHIGVLILLPDCNTR